MTGPAEGLRNQRAKDAEWILGDARRYRQLIAQGRHTPKQCKGFDQIATRLEQIANTLRACRCDAGADS